MKNLKIYLILVGIMLLWGFNVPVLKIIVGQAPPITITSLRILTAGIFVFIILAFLRIVRMPKGNEGIYILLGSLLNVVGHHYFLSMGLTETSAANSGLILGLGPLLTAFLAMAFLRQVPSIIRIMGFFLGTAGTSLTILGNGNGLSGINIGDFYIFISILSQALSFILISKAAKTLDPRLLTGYMLVIGSIILFLLSIWLEPAGLQELKSLSESIWLLFLGSAILGTAVGHMVYNSAIGKIGAAESAIFLNLSTFFSLVGSIIILNEQITVFHFIGLVFIISGVLLGSGTLEEMLLRKRQSRSRKVIDKHDLSP